jgi:hypothetical protein
MDFLPNVDEIVGNPGKSGKAIDNSLDSGVTIYIRNSIIRRIIQGGWSSVCIRGLGRLDSEEVRYYGLRFLRN